MTLKISKAMPELIGTGPNHDRLGMFRESNAYNPDAPGIMPQIAKGVDPFGSIDLNKGPEHLRFETKLSKAEGDADGDSDDGDDDDDDPSMAEANKEEKESEDSGMLQEQIGKSICKACGDEYDMSDPKLKGHKREFKKVLKLHENMDSMRKKSMRGERVSARLKKCIVDEIVHVIKSYGSENLIDTHGEQFMSDADRQVLDWIRSIDSIQTDLSPTHNPPVPRSYASGCKSMSASDQEIYIAQKAFD